MINNKMLEEVKNRLIKVYNPQAIYIFGSYSWGTPDEDSDLDILVVLKTIEQNRCQALVEGHMALMDITNLSKDILILSQEEFEKDSLDKTTLGYKIKLKGRKIYAKA